MKIFILEDDNIRRSWFWNRFDHHTITMIDSCEKAHRFEGGYELILLDHDLGGRQMDMKHEDNGCNFVKVMKKGFEGATVIIHSFNPSGAMNMKAEYPPAIVAPFGGPLFRNLLKNLLKDGRF